LSTTTNTLATSLALLRPLLSTKNEFLWSSFHKEAFIQVKASLTISPMVLFFDITKPTRLSTDAKLQTDKDWDLFYSKKTADTWSLIQAGSQSLSDAETRYVCRH